MNISASLPSSFSPTARLPRGATTASTSSALRCTTAVGIGLSGCRLRLAGSDRVDRNFGVRRQRLIAGPRAVGLKDEGKDAEIFILAQGALLCRRHRELQER